MKPWASPDAPCINDALNPDCDLVVPGYGIKLTRRPPSNNRNEKVSRCECRFGSLLISVAVVAAKKRYWPAIGKHTVFEHCWWVVGRFARVKLMLL